MPRFATLFLAAVFISGCQPEAPVAIAAGGDAVLRLGQPIAGLTPAQLAQFDRGRAVFSRLFNPRTGLGPLFNDNSCRACSSTSAAR